jgi:hypothetical protein
MFGRWGLVAWPGVAVVGLAMLVLAGLGDAPRAWRAVLMAFTFFNPLAVGMVVWSAVVVLARGRWNTTVERLSLAGAWFAPVGLLTLAALWAACPHWATWLTHRMDFQAWWLSPAALFGRDMLLLAALWALAVYYVHRRRSGRPVKLAAVLVLTYCLASSQLGFDLVMALDPHWFSSLFGGYTFISGMYIAMAAWALLAVLTPRRDPNVLHDLGKLLVGFSLLTTYLMYSQLMPIWYNNLPMEVRQPLPRMRNEVLRPVSMVLLATVYLGPLVLLLTRWAKRTPAYLGAMCVLVLAGMLVERWWLIVPMAHAPLVVGWVELGAALAMAGALGLCLTLAYASGRLASVSELSADAEDRT